LKADRNTNIPINAADDFIDRSQRATPRKFLFVAAGHEALLRSSLFSSRRARDAANARLFRPATVARTLAP